MSSPTGTGDVGAGLSGTGSLTIRDGVKVSGRSGYLGFASGSTGVGTVSGIGSQWNSSGNLTVGYYGAGTLTVAQVELSTVVAWGSSGEVPLDGGGDG